MNIWTVVILGSIVYGLIPGPVGFAVRIFWVFLTRLWEDLSGVAQSSAARECVRQAVRISCAALLTSMRTTGTILMLPSIIVQRLWPVAEFDHHPLITSAHEHMIHSPHLKGLDHNINTVSDCERHPVKTVCAGQGKKKACTRSKYLPKGEAYYCAAHIDQGRDP